MNVIKLGGAVALQEDTLDALAAAWDGSDWTLVHGAGPQLDEALRAEQGPAIKVQGLRVTTPAAAWQVRRIMDDIGAAIAKGLRARGLPAIHVPAALRLFQAVPKPIEGLGRVGTVSGFQADQLVSCAPPGTIKVVSPVGWDDAGPLNINADEGAAAVALALRADRLVLATDVPAVLGADGQPIQHMDAALAHEFLASSAARGGMVPKVQAATAVVEGGVGEVRIGPVSCAWQDAGTRISLG